MPTPKILLQTEHLSKIYPRGKNIPLHALHKVSLKVEEGEIFGIIGQSGAGKSTLLRCLSSMESPSEGKVILDGVDIASLDRKGMRVLRKTMGMVFQHFQLLSSKTVAKNIAFPLEIQGWSSSQIQSQVDQLLDWVGLSEHKNAYPATLSGGQKQRVGIARALANSPKILFCDEATSALDTIATRQILELLKTLQKKLGLTIVLITHEMDVIREICDHVAVLSRGEIIENKKTIDLFFSPSHALTKSLLQKATHTQPHPESLPSQTKVPVRLSFRGPLAKEPIISTMIRKHSIDVNILTGWIDEIQGETIGTLIVELSGEPASIETALTFLSLEGVRIEAS